jgi:hypothetical protein
MEMYMQGTFIVSAFASLMEKWNSGMMEYWVFKG